MCNMVTRLAELIAIRSTADRPDELRRALDLVVAEAGPGWTVRRFVANGKPSALLHPPGAADGPFRVVLNAHLDVVPGADEQFEARRDGDRLYGRGAQDMKAAALVLTGVFRELAGILRTRWPCSWSPTRRSAEPTGPVTSSRPASAPAL